MVKGLIENHVVGMNKAEMQNTKGYTDSLEFLPTLAPHNKKWEQVSFKLHNATVTFKCSFYIQFIVKILKILPHYSQNDKFCLYYKILWNLQKYYNYTSASANLVMT